MRILKEPLLHFMVIGALFFWVYSLTSRSGRSSVQVSAEKIQALETAFSNDWNSAPTPDELQRLVEDYIREELAVREGLELGLDQNDPVIRQRLRQKLELLVEEEAVIEAPTDAALQAYLESNADLFRAEDGHLPTLEDIRSLVLFEWENEQRIAQLDQFYKALESKYGVQVEAAAQ